MPETYYIIPKEKHDSLVTKAYFKRGRAGINGI
jgi:hypothetical protein